MKRNPNIQYPISNSSSARPSRSSIRNWSLGPGNSRPDVRGQMLIEALVAMTILVVSIVSIFALISRSVSLNRVVSDQYVGSYLASEGVEIVKNIIDSNILQCNSWNQGITSGQHEVSYQDTGLGFVSGLPLRLDSTSGFYNYSLGATTAFYRTVNITNISADEIAVSSEVHWKGRSNGSFSVVAEDHFFNWRDCTAGN